MKNKFFITGFVAYIVDPTMFCFANLPQFPGKESFSAMLRRKSLGY